MLLVVRRSDCRPDSAVDPVKADPHLFPEPVLREGVAGCIAVGYVLDIGPTDRRFRSVRWWRGLRVEPDPECRLGCPQATAPVAALLSASTIPPVNPSGLPVQASQSMPDDGRPNSYAVPTVRRPRLVSVHPGGPTRARSTLLQSRACGLQRGSIHKSPPSPFVRRLRSAAPRGHSSTAASAPHPIV